MLERNVLSCERVGRRWGIFQDLARLYIPIPWNVENTWKGEIYILTHNCMHWYLLLSFLNFNRK